MHILLRNLIAENKFKIIPVVTRGKSPLIKGWQREGSDNPDVIAAWENKYPDCNWGIITGKPSRLLVIDFDGESGEKEYQASMAQYDTFAVKTANGYHCYFRTEEEFTGIIRIRPGVDIRSRGNLVVAPTSIHKSGFIYTPLNNTAVAPLPDELCPFLRGRDTRKSQGIPEILPVTAGSDSYDGYSITAGNRNNTLFKYGCSLRGKGYTARKIQDQLLSINNKKCAPPLSNCEIDCILKSIMSYPKGSLGFVRNEDDLFIRIPTPFLRYIQKLGRAAFLNHLGTFVAFSDYSNLYGGAPMFNYRRYLNSKYMLPETVTPSIVNTFKELGIVSIEDRRTDGAFTSKHIHFHPEKYLEASSGSMTAV